MNARPRRKIAVIAIGRLVPVLNLLAAALLAQNLAHAETPAERSEYGSSLLACVQRAATLQQYMDQTTESIRYNQQTAELANQQWRPNEAFKALQEIERQNTILSNLRTQFQGVAAQLLRLQTESPTAFLNTLAAIARDSSQSEAVRVLAARMVHL